MPSVPQTPAEPVRENAASRWLAGSALGQVVTAGAFGSVIAAWTAIGASLGAAVSGAAVMCLAVPIFGWFFGLPLVLGFGMAAMACWFAVLSMILIAWACTAFTIAAIALVRRRRAAR